MRWWLSILLCAVLASGRADELPPGVALVLTGHGISPDDVSILVQEGDAEEPILSHLADVPRNPASVMKLVTTWVALEVLGPAYEWPTEVYFGGEFDGRVLHGDLGIKGYGDPFLVVEEFWKMLRVLRGLGLQDIEGDLLLDDSHFSVVEDAPGSFDGEPYRTYNVVPSALMANFKAVRFQFFADPVNGRVNIATDPLLSNLDIKNRINLVEGPCRGFQAGISFNIADPETLAEVVFEGDYSRHCNGYTMSRTVLEHDTYVFGLFDALWGELGGTLRGNLRKGVIGDDQALVLTWRSPPLADVIRSINKNSNNVMTRQLVYTIAAELAGTPATRVAGVEVIREFLEKRGLDPAPLKLINGAGLARDERVSARLLAGVLREAERSPYAAEYVSSLSLGGLDGTTRGRFNGDGNGRMHVKTGRLDHVSALAGYVHAHNGKTYAVVVFGNFENAHRGLGQELEEAVTRWVYAL
ncbi:MAG TPA: D-alanyl-D-alanine carboxypeptidase/D-alanyl-D-alanine-endopeptidase [Gammaproteobacteria bacterium]